MSTPLSALDWDIRLFIYTFWAENERPPTPHDTSTAFSFSVDEAEIIFQRLNDHHHIFLEPQSTTLRMANPLSAVPTNYRVRVKDKSLWANCAWDSLGIAAMLDTDVEVEAVGPLSGGIFRYGVRDGQLENADFVVHFSIPANQWYDNLIHT